MILRLNGLAGLLIGLAATAAVGLTSTAAAQQKTFLLFFDYEKTDIGSGGKDVIETIEKTIKWDGKIAKILLVGHTDATEAASLSLVRALEVSKALVATGAIPSGAEISISGVGASKPLVQTEPNQREPQNRFVSIVLDTGAQAAEANAPRPQPAISPPPSDGFQSIVARIPGDYTCNGSNPNGSSYRCQVTISRNGETYSFRWLIADGTRYSGKGRLRGRTLTVDWGQSAPVIYQVGDDGVLRGTWARGRGREVLTPDR